MILTTTPDVQGKTIRDYHGIVTGEAVLGANLFKDLFAGIRDIVGGRSAAYEKELAQARQVALDELTAAARTGPGAPTPSWASTSTTRCLARTMAC